MRAVLRGMRAWRSQRYLVMRALRLMRRVEERMLVCSCEVGRIHWQEASLNDGTEKKLTGYLLY
jgi:hypothetical protein